MTMTNPRDAALRALGEEDQQFTRHAALTLTMSTREPSEFVGEVVKLVHQLTGLSVRLVLSDDLTPYYSDDEHVWDHLIGLDGGRPA